MRHSVDELLVRRELYNPNKFDLIFELDQRFIQHIKLHGRPTYHFKWMLKADMFQVVPHMYWTITTSNGSPTYDLIQNFSKTIGMGNKHPSLPVVDTKWQK